MLQLHQVILRELSIIIIRAALDMLRPEMIKVAKLARNMETVNIVENQKLYRKLVHSFTIYPGMNIEQSQAPSSSIST